MREQAERPADAVIVDFDRTLLRTDKSISACTIRVMEALRERGVWLFAATARPERAITEYLETISFDAVTTLNGARTIARGDVLECPIRPESAGNLLDQLLAAGGTAVTVEAESGIYANTEIPEWSPIVPEDLRILTRREKIYKILASHPEIPPERIGLRLPGDTYSTVADGKLVQVMSRDATKWNGVKKMLEAFRVDPVRAAFFGDDNDDLEPIVRCGLGVAVRNGLERIREAADSVTDSNDEDGVAVFLARLFGLAL